MTEVAFSESDLVQEVVTFGIDVFPPIEIRDERTHLNMFYEAGRSTSPTFFHRLSASDVEFRISGEFRENPTVHGPSLPVVTFELTLRGPVIRFPLLLPKPIGRTELKDNYVDRFNEIRRLFFRHLPSRKVMRVGLVRDVVFATGAQRSDGVLRANSNFGAADLSGGACQYHYRDARCNVLVRLEPVQAFRVTELPVGGTVSEPGEFGLKVGLDVNNAEVRPLEEADIQEVIERATSFWPKDLLEFLNGRAEP